MQIVWRFDVVMTMVATVGRIIAGWIVWQAIFQGKEMVGGFDFQSMLSYYLICSILRSIDFSNQISDEVSELIRGGRFSGHMVTPMNPFGFFSSMVAGESAFHLGFSFAAAVICAVFFRVSVTLTGDAAQIMLAVAMIVIGLIFMAAFQYFMGIMTFKFTEIYFLMHVQWNIIAFATGSMVPLSLLPNAIFTVLQFLPFSHVVFTPTMLLIGQTDVHGGLFGLAVLVAWTMMMLYATQFTYSRLRVKYDGVGI